jgi:hypothetical protein
LRSRHTAAARRSDARLLLPYLLCCRCRRLIRFRSPICYSIDFLRLITLQDYLIFFAHYWLFDDLASSDLRFRLVFSSFVFDTARLERQLRATFAFAAS